LPPPLQVLRIAVLQWSLPPQFVFEREGMRMTPMVTISYILKRQVELHLGSRRRRTRSRHSCTKRTLRRRRFKKRCAAL
jgi:hypothetical protein